MNATVNQNVVTYPVIIEVPNPDLALRPNMTANVTIDVAVARDTLRIPNAALRFRPEEKEGAAPGATPRRRSPGATRRSGRGAQGPAAAMKQFDRSTGGKGRRAGQTVYTLAAGGLGEPRAVEIRTGITDSRFTQVVSGELKAGDIVIVGLATTKADAAPRSPGASGGPGAGGRRF